ncbi:PWWP domain-containing protein 5-like [Salvia miltiorrhiza]|uniref:PWWP domain-containing protein 5-like n=1 Tax=Salvia miltiorrhiza TaxID=226208 RepID=UPI0025AD8422|nr:PWWP domain-containing protein 5-like [Salvia miltiorrhiza]
MEISGDKGALSGGVRVSEESKVSTGESNRGTVISASESKSVESSNLGSNDVSQNQSADKVSRNDRWESWGVMNMVGKVLGGKLYVDDEVEDVNDSENGGQVTVVGGAEALQDVIVERTSENRGGVNLVADMNVHEDVMWEPSNGVDMKRMDINSDSAKLDLDCPVEGNNNGNSDMVSCGIVPDGNLETEEINDVKDDMLRSEGFGKNKEVNDVKADVSMPKGDGELDLHINDVKPGMLIPEECSGKTEKEGEYNVSDLVWGKVRSHPWWPGQIFAPSAASDNAKKYSKKESYLVAYFGDQSFAWNDGSKLMPFRKHFSEMVKQSNTDGFSHALSCALDEAARRIEIGLSCPCWAQEVRDEIKFQVVENAGIREESSIIAGGDNVLSAATFLPGHVLQFLESLAKCPRSNRDRLQFTIAKAELQAYTRWKGYHELPVFEECIGLSEDDTQTNAMGEGNDSIEAPVPDAANDISSKKRKSTAQNGSSGDEERPNRKEKFMSVLMSSGGSCSRNNDKVYVRKTFKRAVSSSKSREMVVSTCSNSRGNKQKTLLSTCAAASGIDAKLAKVGAGESQIVEIVPAEIPTPDMVLSELILAAKRPRHGKDAMIPVVGWLREFRNSISLKKSSLGDQEVDLGKDKEEQSSQAADILGFRGIEDSYWTDRIIRNYSQDQAMSESQKPHKKGDQPEADVAEAPNLDGKNESNDIGDLDTRNQSALTNEVSEEYRPTALILNFKRLDSIPSIKDLNEMFSRYGTLDESETKILSKSRRGKVIFNRPADAETAFSNVRKYSIFGSALVSYRLQYITKPNISQKTSKKKKKDKKQDEQNVDAV